MGGSSAKYGGGHQPSMGRGVINQVWVGGSSTNYGGGTIMQQWGIGVSIFPPVCTGSQNPQNYFSNTYVLPSVNRTAGPIRYKLRIGLKANRSSYLSRGIFVQISVALTPTLCVEKRKLCLIIDQSQGKKKELKAQKF